MSDGAAKLVITSDIKDVVRNNDRLTKEVAKLKEALRQLKSEAGSMGDSWSKGLKQIEMANDKWAIGLKKISAEGRKAAAAMEGITRTNTGFSDITKKIDNMVVGLVSVSAVVGAARFAYGKWKQETDQLAESHRRLSAEIVNVVSASSLSGPQTEQWLAGLSGVTREQGMASLAGATQAQPFMPQKRQMALAAQAARQAPTGVDLRTFGGAIADIGAIAEGKSAQDVADLTVKTQQLAGEKFEALRSDAFQRGMSQMVKSGKSVEQALAEGIVAADMDISGRAFATGKARLDRKAVSATAAELIDAQRVDLSEQRLRDLSGYESGREALAGQAVAVAAESGGRGAAIATDRQSRMDKLRQAIANQQGGLAPAGAALQSGMDSIDRFLGMQGTMVEDRNTIQGMTGEAQRRGIMTAEQADQFIKAMQDNTAATQAANRQRGAVNIDRHTDN